ncbi:uncharacterized protein A4U43_C01F7980 [Asparagus officinalis]|uniref:CRIB domain-containing protein n=2 Tax=Asparagus officinalis TaxID=4686 RepID=A0A5P1FMS3_ASPOF|nr:uncharacterized protein A4U43_C01F7980 [Asparagus officinalis]
MQIGLPTDVKHVAHIGFDGPSVSSPSWMGDFQAGSSEPQATIAPPKSPSQDASGKPRSSNRDLPALPLPKPTKRSNFALPPGRQNSQRLRRAQRGTRRAAPTVTRHRELPPEQRSLTWASTQKERPQRHRRQRHPQLHLVVAAGLACTCDQQAQEEEGEGVVVEQQQYVEGIEVEGGREAAVAGV